MLAADNILSFIRDHVVLVSIIKKIASKTSGLHPSLSTNWKEHFDFFVSVWCCLRIHEEKKRRISFPISNPRFQEPTSPVEKIRNPGPAKWVDKEVNQENIHKIFFDEYCCCGPGKKRQQISKKVIPILVENDLFKILNQNENVTIGFYVAICLLRNRSYMT